MKDIIQTAVAVIAVILACTLVVWWGVPGVG